MFPLRGGYPGLNRGQQILAISRKKTEKKREEDEKILHTNDCLMRELLGVGAPHPKSHSSSVQAGTSRAGGQVQDRVEAVPQPGEVPAMKLSDQLKKVKVPEKETPSAKTAAPVLLKRAGGQVKDGVEAVPQPGEVPAMKLSDQLKKVKAPEKEAPSAKTAAPVLLKRAGGQVHDGVEAVHQQRKVLIVDSPVHLSSPSKWQRETVIQMTPTKSQVQPSVSTPDLVADTQHDIEHDGEAMQDQQSHYGGADQAIEVRVGVSPGSGVQHLFYIGSEGQTAWNSALLSNYFVLAPPHPAVCFRLDGDCSLDILVNQVRDHFKLEGMMSPNLIFKGQNINLLDTVSMYPEKALFILLNGYDVPVEIAAHEGKLWQCVSGCSGSVNDRDHMRKKKNCQHQYMFEGLIPKGWGKNHDKPDRLKPWGCPAGHGGVHPQVSHAVGGCPPALQDGQVVAKQPSQPRSR